MSIIDWLIGDLPPGLAFLSAAQTLMLVLIWQRMREIAHQGHEMLRKIMDRFEASDASHTRDHASIEKDLAHVKARVNGGGS